MAKFEPKNKAGMTKKGGTRTEDGDVENRENRECSAVILSTLVVYIANEPPDQAQLLL